MAKVWMPWEGLIHSPWPREKRDESVAMRPRKRDQWVRAIDEIGREIGGAGAVKSVSLGPARGHEQLLNL
jgi:hypothetical protein